MYVCMYVCMYVFMYVFYLFFYCAYIQPYFFYLSRSVNYAINEEKNIKVEIRAISIILSLWCYKTDSKSKQVNKLNIMVMCEKLFCGIHCLAISICDTALQFDGN